MKQFAETHEQACFHMNLGQKRYYSCLEMADVVVGNSSSGLYEAPSFGIATVNIGNRQKGRLQAASTLNCAFDCQAIVNAIEQALVMEP